MIVYSMAEKPLLVYQQFDFTGGLFTKLGSYNVPPNCAYKLQNVKVVKGGIRKIDGTSKLNSTKIGDFQITSLYRAYVGSDSCTLATAGTNMYYWTGSAWTSIKSGLTADNPWSYVTYNGTVYAMNGVDTPQKIDITLLPSYAPTASDWTTAPTGFKWLVLVPEKDIIWAMVNTANPERARYCARNTDGTADSESWPTDNYVPFPSTASAETIVSGTAYNGNLLILTDNSICLLTGATPYEFGVMVLERNKGCTARRSVAQLGNDVIFLGKDGIYLFSGQRAHRISSDIQVEIDDINRTYIDDAVAVTDEHAYYLSYCSTEATGTVNNRLLMFDTEIGDVIGGIVKGGWTGPHIIGAASFCRYGGSNDTGEIYFGDATSTGFVHKFMDTSATDFSGSAIDMIFESRDIDYRDLGALDIEKAIEEIIIVAEPEGSYNLTVSYAKDNSSTFTDLITTLSLATSGPKKGDRDTTVVTRTIILYPKKFTESDSNCYFVRIRIRQNGTGCRAVVRGLKVTATQLVPIRR
ncbi:MAG: hypothetical protein QME51_04110 [Planctomycetota bacterium]|nr:hypothetical protein [Planctomycetota bacterium]